MPIPARWSNSLLALLRVVTGLAFLHHGVSKFFGIPPFPLPLTPLLSTAGVLELVGGTLIVLGLFVRPTAFLLSGMSAVAYFLVHAPRGFFPAANGGEPALLYAFVFLYFAAAGGGAWSIDALRAAKSA